MAGGDVIVVLKRVRWAGLMRMFGGGYKRESFDVYVNPYSGWLNWVLFVIYVCMYVCRRRTCAQVKYFICKYLAARQGLAKRAD